MFTRFFIFPYNKKSSCFFCPMQQKCPHVFHCPMSQKGLHTGRCYYSHHCWYYMHEWTPTRIAQSRRATKKVNEANMGKLGICSEVFRGENPPPHSFIRWTYSLHFSHFFLVSFLFVKFIFCTHKMLGVLDYLVQFLLHYIKLNCPVWPRAFPLTARHCIGLPPRDEAPQPILRGVGCSPIGQLMFLDPTAAV